MKIIGETKEGYIIEASKDEVANIMGFYSNFQIPTDKKVKIGEEIEIEKIYARYRAFESIIKSKDFNNALLRLTDTIEVLTPVEKLFNQTKEILK